MNPPVADKDITLNLFGRDVNLSKTLKSAGDQADKTSGKLAALGKVGVVTGLASTLPAALNVVSSALTLTTAAAALAPGAILAAGAAYATAAIGIAYFGQALKDVRDPKKFAADLKGLAPAAQATAKAFRTLLPALDNLRLNIQQNLFAGAAKEIKQLSNEYLPTLRGRLTSIAAALGHSGNGFARFLGDPKQVKYVDQVLASTATTVAILGKALQPVTGAFLQLAAVGSKFLPSFASLIGVAANQFAVFVSNGVKSGQIVASIKTGITIMKLFLGILNAVRQSLGGILSAAAHTPQGLASIAGFFQALATAINSPAFQGGLVAFFTGLNSAAGSLAGLLPQVSAALVAISPALGSVAAGLGAGFASAISSVAQLIISLAPEINSLAASFALIAPSIAPAVVAFLAISRVVGPVTTIVKVVRASIGAFQSLVVGIRLVATAFRFLGLALDVNPIFLIVTAIGLLAIGLYEAYQHSTTFRVIVQAAFRAVAGTVLAVVSGILDALQHLFAAASHIPGIGGAMKSVAGAFAAARGYIDGVRTSIAGIPTHVGVAIDVAYNVSVSGPAGILGVGKYGGPGQGLGVLAPQGQKKVTIGKPSTSPPKVSYNSGLGVGKGFGDGVGDGVKKATDYTNNKFVKYAKSLQAKLEAATQKLADILKARAAYIKQLRDSLIAATAITGFEADPNRRGTPGADYYIKYLATRLKALKAYTANVARLRKEGLNKTSLQQILDAGVDGGSDDAAALAAGGKKAVAQVNKIQGQIGKTAGGLATGVGNQFYKTGVEAAKGLVAGLKSARGALLKVAASLAKGLRDAIRKELKIKSPSRALAEDGRYAGLGFLQGVNSTRPAIAKSLANLGRPTGSFAGATRSGSTVVHNHYTVQAAVIDDSSGVIRKLDQMAKGAKSRGYRPQTIAFQGR